MVSRVLVLGAAAVAVLSVAAAPPARAGEISGERTYSGEVVVPKGETWKVLPGTILRFRGGSMIVRGRLLVEGTVERPVRIAADESFEGIDLRGGSGSEISGAVLSGGRRGVRLTGASAVFRKVRWVGNGVGLEVGQYSKAVVDGCVFETPFRAGILVKRGGEADVSGSRFERAGKAGMYVYGAAGTSVRGSRFEGNAAGLQVAMSGGRVTAERCVFRKNGTGILAERMAVPKVSGCDVEENRVGMLFSRRAGGEVSGSRIEGNGDGVVVEFSSYPVFRGNRFLANRGMDVRLRHQSSQWEEEVGDSGRDSRDDFPFGVGPDGRKDFAPGAPPRQTRGDGFVDFRENDWGAGSGDIAGGGNAASVHDGRDEPEFEYKGRRYRMDRVLLK